MMLFKRVEICKNISFNPGNIKGELDFLKFGKEPGFGG